MQTPSPPLLITPLFIAIPPQKYELFRINANMMIKEDWIFRHWLMLIFFIDFFLSFFTKQSLKAWYDIKTLSENV